MSTSKGDTQSRFLEQVVGGQRIRWRILRERLPEAKGEKNSKESAVSGFTLKDQVVKNYGVILYY